MSRIYVMCLIFILGATGWFPAAAADLPKQGDFKVNFYGHGTYKGFSVGKTQYELVFGRRTGSISAKAC